MGYQSQPYEGTDILEALMSAKRYNAHIAGLIKAAAGDQKDLVDFGAGIGTTAELLRDQGFHLSAVEADAGHRRRLAEKGVLSVERLGEIAKPQQFIYSLNVIEHVDDDVGLLKEFHDTLGVGGRVLIFVPAFRALWTSLDDHVGHRRRYTRTMLTAKMQEAGFKVEQVQYVDSMGALAAAAFKLLGLDSSRITPGSVGFYDRYIFPLSYVADTIANRWFGKNVLAVGRKY